MIESLKDKIQDLRNRVSGLSLEVEGMRIHQSSSAEFILGELRAMTKEIKELMEKLK